MSSTKNKATSIAILGMFSAIIVVLQLMSYFIKIGNTVNLSLVLIPIVLGAALYGPKKGAILGGVFGAVVVICCVTGLDAGAYILFTARPVITVIFCILKGVAAGLAAGYAAKAFKAKPYISVLAAALAAPIVNTGLFCACMLLFFRDTLSAWAGGTEILYYMVFSLIGINFLVELAVNLVFSPAVLRIMRAVKRI